MKENFKMVYSMKNLWFNNGEKCISFSFDKELVKKFIKVLKTDTVKGLDSIYQKSISIFGFVITYGDFNYNRIVYVMINHQKDIYNWQFLFIGSHPNNYKKAVGISASAGKLVRTLTIVERMNQLNSRKQLAAASKIEDSFKECLR